MSVHARAAVAVIGGLFSVACGDDGGSSEGGSGGTSNGTSSTSAGGSTTSGTTTTRNTTSNSTSTANSTSTTSTGGGGSTSSSTTSGGLDQDTICQESCEQQALCLDGLDVATCLSNCDLVATTFTGDCVDKQLAEFECAGNLSCDEMNLYFEDKVSHSACGAVYSDFATSCLFNDGVPPEECVDFCTLAYSCDDTVLPVAGCSQSCNELLSGFELGAGTSCASAFQQAYGCFAAGTCDDIATIQAGSTPSSCSSFDQLVVSACQ